MTHELPDFSVKKLTDDYGERWYVFFRVNVTEPFLVLAEPDIQRLHGIVVYEREAAATATEGRK